MKYFLQRSVFVLGILVVMSGCQDWPHFDYESADTRHVDENETDTEGAQDLSLLTSPVVVVGDVSSSDYRTAEEYPPPIDVEAWYYGDIDWFQFKVRDSGPLSILLTWTDSSSDLDISFFTVNEDLTVSPKGGAAAGGPGPEEMTVDGLEPYDTYVVAIAGRIGSNVGYELELSPP